MNRNNLILASLILLKFLLQWLAIDSGYELHRDEYLHLDLGKHLAWGYSSVPPVTGWISFMIYSLGNSVFWVKFFPAIFGGLTIVLVWKVVEELKGGMYARILAAFCVLFSALLRINTLYQPNSLDFLMWTFVFFALLKYINSENKKWLWAASLSFALGFLNKYNIVFLALGLLPAILLTRQRSVLLKRDLYYSLLLALLVISPNLIWQFTNDFPVLQHLKTLADTQLIYVNRMDFFKEQLLFFIGGLPVLILALISFFTYPPFKKYRVFFWSFVFTLLIFAFFKAKSYYAIGLYPIFLAFGSVYVEYLLGKGWLNYIRPVLLTLPVIVIVFLFKIMVPVLTPEQITENPETFKRLGLLRWEDGEDHKLPQDYADMLGWSELAGLVDTAFEEVEEKKHTLIHCDNYGQAGGINYYSRQKFTQAVSINADYINWYPLDEMEIRNVILVKGRYDQDRDREREKTFFESVSLIGTIENPYAREYGTRVYLLKGAKQSINAILRAEIQDQKRKR